MQKRVLVVGGRGGVGSGLVETLIQRGDFEVHATSRHARCSTETQMPVRWHVLDPTCEMQVAELADTFRLQIGAIDWIVNCVGLLSDVHWGPEKSLNDVTHEVLMENIRVNTLPTLLLAKHFRRNFVDSSAVFAAISARVGSIDDNRLGGWYSYRASKAALNMSLKTIAIEWSRCAKQVCVASLHPGTTASDLSRPFTAKVAPEVLFSPQRAGEHLLQNLLRLTPEFSGRFWAWDGTEISW